MVGLRLEQTHIEYTGATFDATKVGNTSKSTNTDDYLNVLPSILAKYTVSENTVVKASVTNSLARPNYYDLVPYKLISRDVKRLLIVLLKDRN